MERLGIRVGIAVAGRTRVHERGVIEDVSRTTRSWAAGTGEGIHEHIRRVPETHRVSDFVIGDRNDDRLAVVRVRGLI